MMFTLCGAQQHNKPRDDRSTLCLLPHTLYPLGLRLPRQPASLHQNICRDPSRYILLLLLLSLLLLSPLVLVYVPTAWDKNYTTEERGKRRSGSGSNNNFNRKKSKNVKEKSCARAPIRNQIILFFIPLQHEQRKDQVKKMEERKRQRHVVKRWVKKLLSWAEDMRWGLDCVKRLALNAEPLIDPPLPDLCFGSSLLLQPTSVLVSFLLFSMTSLDADSIHPLFDRFWVRCCWNAALNFSPLIGII